MTITGTYHITATEKRHIKQLIENGWLKGGTKKKFYTMEETASGFVGTVSTKCKDDSGRAVVRKQKFTVLN